MVRFLKRLVLAVIAWIVMLGLFYAVMYLVLFSPPKIAERSILHVVASGALPEAPPASALARLLKPQQLSMGDVLASLRNARHDPRITAVFLDIGALNTGWAKVEELHDTLKTLRDAGKYVAAFLTRASEKEYLLASAADHISMVPGGHLMLDGLAASVTYVKDLIDKTGIEPTVVSIGKYKSAANPVLRNSMSPANREQITAILDDLFNGFVGRVARRRELKPRKILAYINGGSYRSGVALKAGLIDAEEYADEVLARLATKIGRTDARAALVPLAKYRRVSSSSLGPETQHTIALIYGSGTIVTGKRFFAPGVGDLLTAHSFAAMLRRASADEEAEAIIVRIDSPGGSALASDILWREIHQARRRKPVVASMSDVAASGGYYIAMAAERIVAQPSTITGSIGILGGKLNNQKLYQWLGVHREVITRGKFAGALDDSRPFTAEEMRRFKEDLQYGYDLFASKAARDRGLSREKLEAAAQGRVWTGNQALAMGLVDVLGGLTEAVAEAKRLAKIPEKDEVRLVIYSPEQRSIREMLLRNLSLAWLESVVPPSVLRLLGMPRRLLTKLLDGPLAIMPFSLEIE